MRIKGVGPSGLENIYTDEQVRRFMAPVQALLTPDDVVAVTIHREGGDHRYERADQQNAAPTGGSDG